MNPKAKIILAALVPALLIASLYFYFFADESFGLLAMGMANLTLTLCVANKQLDQEKKFFGIK
jgi:hypothetical protein